MFFNDIEDEYNGLGFEIEDDENDHNFFEQSMPFYLSKDYKDNNFEEEANEMQITEGESKKNSENAENINETPKTETKVMIIKTETGKISLKQDKENTVNFNSYYKKDNSETDSIVKDISFININDDDLKSFDKIDLKSEKEKSEDNIFNSHKRKRGRNGPGETGGEHNKFSDDNLRRKVKHLVLKNVFDFINEKIRTMYKSINKGIFSKKLLTINQKQISDATILFNKKFLEKTLMDIFSVEISKRYTNYFEYHNKNIINALINDEDEIKRDYFKGLFSLRFIDCLEHFRGTADYFHLDGLVTFDEIKDEYATDKNYLNTLTTYIYNYENITKNKKERTSFYYDY